MKNSKLGQMTAEERIKAKEKAKENFKLLETEFMLEGNDVEMAYFKNIPQRFKSNWLTSRIYHKDSNQIGLNVA